MNRERVLYLDIAKGFAILFMFTQHCMLVHEYAGGDSEHWLSVLFVLLGTAPAAPVFMIIMGVFTMKSRAGLKEQVLRGFKLLGLGYLLNLLRLPMLLPEGPITGDLPGALLFNILTLTDILQLAGLSIILGAVLKKHMNRPVLPPLIIAVIFFISPYLWGRFPENPVLLIFWGNTENTYFPFFPWAAYPLIGMYLSRFLLREGEEPDPVLHTLALIGLGFIVAAVLLLIFKIFPIGDYSRSGMGIHLLILGFVFIWLKICRLMELRLPTGHWAMRQLTFLSRNITTIYFVQWILFSWSILLFGANQQGPYTAAAIGLGVFILTSALVRMKPFMKPG